MTSNIGPVLPEVPFYSNSFLPAGGLAYVTEARSILRASREENPGDNRYFWLRNPHPILNDAGSNRFFCLGNRHPILGCKEGVIA